MFAARHDFFRALLNARRATRAGNYADADKWTRLAERHLIILERLDKCVAVESPRAAQAPTGPVMLDPKGFSPGGTPNWVLNQNRMDRARDGTRNPAK